MSDDQQTPTPDPAPAPEPASAPAPATPSIGPILTHGLDASQLGMETREGK